MSLSESAPPKELIQVPGSRPISSVRGENKDLSKVSGEEKAEMNIGVATAIVRPTSGKNGTPRKTGTPIEDKVTPAPQADVKRLRGSCFKDVLAPHENSDSDAIQFISALPAPGEVKKKNVYSRRRTGAHLFRTGLQQLSSIKDHSSRLEIRWWPRCK